MSNPGAELIALAAFAAVFTKHTVTEVLEAGARNRPLVLQEIADELNMPVEELLLPENRQKLEDAVNTAVQAYEVKLLGLAEEIGRGE